MKKLLLVMITILIVYGALGYSQEALFGTRPFIQLSIEFSTMEAGRETNRTVVLYSRTEAGITDVYTRVENPTFLRNLQFLSLGRQAGQPEQWVRTSSGLRRLPQSSQGEALFSSAVENTDIILPVLNPVPKESAALPPEFSHLQTYQAESFKFFESLDGLRRYYKGEQSGLIYGFDVYESSGNRVKTYRVQEIQVVQGEVLPSNAIMEDTRSRRTTRLTVEEVSFPGVIPARFFNPQALR